MNQEQLVRIRELANVLTHHDRAALKAVLDRLDAHEAVTFRQGALLVCRNGKIHDLEAELAEWHVKRYGDRPVDIDKTIRKMVEEFGELARAIGKDDKPNAIEEAGDLVMVCVHIVRALGGKLGGQILDKLGTITQRLSMCRKSNCTGTLEHRPTPNWPNRRVCDNCGAIHIDNPD